MSKNIETQDGQTTKQLYNKIYEAENEFQFISSSRNYLNAWLSAYGEREDISILSKVALNDIAKIARAKNFEGVSKTVINHLYSEILNNYKCSQMNKVTNIKLNVGDGVINTINFDIDMKGLLHYDNSGDLAVTAKGSEDIANEFIKIFGIRAGRQGIDAFIPQQGIWTNTSFEWLPQIVNQTLIKKTNTHLTNKVVDEIAKRIKINAFDIEFEESIFNKKYLKVTFNNGTLDISKNIFNNEFFKEDYSTVKIPWNYRQELKDVRPQKLDKFLSMMLDEESINLVYQLIGATFVKKYIPKKFFILYGAGDNGKTTLLTLLSNLVGEKKNVSYVSLEGLTDPNNRFQRVQLMNKLINVCGEVPPNYVMDTHVLKMLTGGDIILAEKKGVDAKGFENFANIFLSCNKLPRFSDTTLGMRNRLLIIPMQKPFKANVTDKNINKENIHIDDIINDTDLMENIIAYSIEEFKKSNYGKKLIEPSSVKEILDEYYQEDPILSFIEEYYDITANTDDRILCKDILSEFDDYKENEKMGLSSKFNANTFGHAIQERFPTKVIYKPRYKLKGDSKTKANVLIGIKEKTFVEIDMPMDIKESFNTKK